ncbi:MAG: hypothetical protein V1897_05630 [Pseudomonadota bacterium]
MKTRQLSEKFYDDLMKDNGLLHPILERVKQDHTLMIAIRGKYINIYYRGGNILKVDEQGKGSYLSSFDAQYNKYERDIPVLPAAIISQDDAKTWVAAIPHLKELMDLYFSIKSKDEREFQQLVARENNYSSISNESEYFISDIEFADSGLGARFDMLAIRWLASKRKNGSNCQAALIEMKYGDDALGGSAGLLKHLQDIDNFVSDETSYQTSLKTMESQFNQLDQLGLLKFNQCSNDTKVKLDLKDKPEVIFLLANHNPRSTKLRTILDHPDIVAYGQSERFDLKFFVASFAGYGLHAKCMVSLAEFRKLL